MACVLSHAVDRDGVLGKIDANAQNIHGLPHSQVVDGNEHFSS